MGIAHESEFVSRSLLRVRPSDEVGPKKCRTKTIYQAIGGGVLLPLCFLVALVWLLGSGQPALAAGEAPGRVVTVDMVDIEFKPSRIQINPGDRIRFVNKDPFEHTALLVNSADQSVQMADTRVKAHETFTTPPISRPGVFDLYCTLHGGMIGKVSTTGHLKHDKEAKHTP